MTSLLELFWVNLFERFTGKGVCYLPFIEIRAISSGWYRKQYPSHPQAICKYALNVDAALTAFDELNKKDGYNLFFGVLPRPFRKGSRDFILKSSTLWVDIDNDKEVAKERLLCASLGLPPNFIVDSGNGIHCYYLLDSISEDLDLIESRNMEISRLVGGDKCHDRARVMRIPGSRNWKDPSFAPQVEIIYSNLEQHTQLSNSFFRGDRNEPTPRSLSVPCSFSNPSEDVSLDGVSRLWQRYIYEGISADSRGYYLRDGKPDKSVLDYCVIRELVKNGYDDDQIYSIFTNNLFGISEKTLEKPKQYQQAYLRTTIDKVKSRY